MKRILEMIEAEKCELANHDLFQWLSDERVDGAERLAFAPAMLYFLMGFKDVLANLERKDASTELEKMVNAYCVEDGHHWRWYLSDLEKLGFSVTSWGGSIPAACEEIWSDASRANRETIFSFIHYSRLTDDPLFALVLVQILEATGELFLINSRKAAKAMNMDDTLLYFGRVHYEAELGHTVQPINLEGYELSGSSHALAQRVVPELFLLFGRMMGSWYDLRGRFRLRSTPVSTSG